MATRRVDPDYSEIKPGLFLGGTPAEFDSSVSTGPRPSELSQFDVVFTFHSGSTPVNGDTLEVRYTFDDNWDDGLAAENYPRINSVAEMAHSAWKDGNKVLLRCQGGKNRSGLVMGVVLLLEGLDADAAIELMREKRDQTVLFNEHFVKDLHSWRFTN